MKRPSRIAYRIYAIGLVQFLVVALVLEVDHRMRYLAPVASGPPPAPPILLVASVILVVVGVGSWLTARSFARPLARLAETARAFGAGKLDARARMDRADEIGDVAQALDEMADRLARLVVAERELLANVSHELRTPLARIRVALDIAAELSELSEAEGKAGAISLADIAHDLAELERIVEDVLASARLALDTGAREGKGLPLRAEPGDVRALLDKSAALFRVAHPSRELVVDLPEALGTVVADPVLLRRVVDNLLENAHKYTNEPDRPVTLRAELADADADAKVVVTVVDRGIGIGEEDQKRLFEPFFRVDRSRSRATGGLGLGLLLARQIVEAHGGTLTIASTLNEGTTATVTLPVAR
ncbi:MAG: HAMP domain-containing histidine kinase [Labilithrix sp.]|nr:HAMP domain-containing histidine kinase [Labilithrix sp.]MCW5816047.1 HAMP domain-containing histidine kinase [Labilithrix sp.]